MSCIDRKICSHLPAVYFLVSNYQRQLLALIDLALYRTLPLYTDAVTVVQYESVRPPRARLTLLSLLNSKDQYINACIETDSVSPG